MTIFLLIWVLLGLAGMVAGILAMNQEEQEKLKEATYTALLILALISAMLGPLMWFVALVKAKQG